MSSLRTREIFSDATLTLLAVESVEVQRSRSAAHIQFGIRIEPIAVIVRSPTGVTALDMEAKPISLDELKREIPVLENF